MIIKTTKKPTDLAPEGEYPAELKSVAYKNENKKCVLTFEIKQGEKMFLVPKEPPASFDAGPLRKDLEVLNEGEFTRKQIEEGIEPETFIGRKCRVLVIHKKTSGQKMVAVVNVLMPLAAKPVKHTASAPETPAAVQSGAGD